MKKTTRTLSLLLAFLMVLGVCPLGVLASAATEAAPAAETPKEWTDEDYAKLYVTDADGDGVSDLVFKWDAFDLEAGTVVTELVNQVEGGANVALNKKFNGSSLANTSDVSKVSDGTEKNTVLGNPGEDDQAIIENVANYTVDTNGAVLTTATLDFSALLPSHMVGNMKVLDDMTFEMTLFQQNFYDKNFYTLNETKWNEVDASGKLLGGDEGTNNAYQVSSTYRSAARFGPFSTSRYIHDNITYVKNKYVPAKPYDESYGFIAHSTLGFTSTAGGNSAYVTDVDPSCTTNNNKRVYGNYRLKTYTVGIVFDYTVAENETTGTYGFQFVRDGQFVYSDYVKANYDADHCGYFTSSTASNAHNNFWFGGNLPFAYRALRMYSAPLSEAQALQNHAAELLDYYRVDLTDFNELTGTSFRAEAYRALEPLRLGETSKAEIEAILDPIAEKVAAEKAYADLYVTDADGDGVSDLLFKWDAFDLEAGTVVTELVNQVEGGANVALGKKYKGKNNITLGEDASLVGTVSDGTEKDTVLGDTTATNLVANSTIDTKGALLTTSALDFTAIQPWQTLASGEQVLADVTFEATMFQQNYYPTGLVQSATLFGPFANSRCIHDNNVAAPNPVDESYGFISHTTFGFMRKGSAGYGAWNTDKSSEPKVFGNYRLATYTVGVLFDYTVANDATVARDTVTGTFFFDYYRDGAATNASDGLQGDYFALQSGGNSADAHNKFHFGGNLPFAYRAIRMYSAALSEAQMAQNHAAELLDYYRVDLSVYSTLSDGGRAKANAELANLRLGETSKAAIEAIINTDKYKAMTYDYSDLYVADGLVFLWSGEGNTLTDSTQPVSALTNKLGGGLAIDKVTYGRQPGNYANASSWATTPKKDSTNTYYIQGATAAEDAVAIFKAMSAGGYYVVDKGVVSPDNARMILTELLPTATVDEKTVLTDMTLEVSQMYFDDVKVANDKYASSLNTTYIYRGNDGGANWFGPLSTIGHTKMTYNARMVDGVRYYAIMYKDQDGVFHDIYGKNNSGSFLTKDLYSYDESTDTMTQITDADTLAWIRATDSSGKPTNLWVNEKAQYTSTSFDINNPYKNYPAMDANGVMGVHSMITGYDDAGKPQFINNTVNQAFTTTMIFDYAALATSTTYNVTLGRDGAILGTPYTNKTYNADTDYSDYSYTAGQSGFIGTYDPYYQTTGYERYYSIGVNDGKNYAFTYGPTIGAVYYGIRVYDRVLSEAEQAQNNFIDIAFQLDANLYDYVNAPYDYIRNYVHKKTAGTAAADWTADEIEALIQEAYEEAAPPYSALYVQDGLVFLWTGEGNNLPESSSKSPLSLGNAVGKNALTLMTTQRGQYGKNAPTSITSNFLYVVDKGVLKADPDKNLVIENLVPYRTANDANSTAVLKDMTVEVSQMYPDTYKTYASQSASVAKRAFDADTLRLGPVTSSSYSKASAHCFYHTDGNYYISYSYKAEGATEAQTVYANLSNGISTSNSIKFTLYSMQENGTMTAHPDLVNMYVDYDNGKNMIATIDSATNETVYIDASSRFSPAISRYNHMTTYQANFAPFDSAQNGPVLTGTFGNYDNLTTNSSLVYMNAKPNEVFTNSFTFNFNESNLAATSFGYTFTIGRNGEALDYTKTGTYNASDATHAKFNIGVDATTVYYAIRIYDCVLTPEEQAQNNFIDIAYQLDLDLRAYAKADKDLQVSIHELTVGKAAADFDAEELQTQVDLILEGGKEYDTLANSGTVAFDGYSVRLHSYPGLRAVFKVDRDLIKAAEKNTLTKIKEIGAIVGIKGKHNDSVEDLTVAGGKQMQKHAVYANGAWAKNEQGEEKLFYRLNANGELETYFALTTTFAKENEQTEQYYETELLFRGYMTLDVNGKEVTVYTDMEAPSFDTVSMCAVSEVFASRGWEYKDVATIKNVLETCGLSMPYADKTYAADSFLKADGSLDTKSTGDLNVLFIGGSLTQGGKNGWALNVANHIQTMFPNKKVNYTNVGVGGTTSEDGAIRFAEHVAPYDPDIIFIEFTVNDDMSGFTEERAQYRMENFLYQCSQLDKIPTVIYSHNPPATLPNSAVYNEWYQQVEYKEEWAAHYSIETINIYDYSYGKYQAELKAGTTTVDYITWLGDYYKKDTLMEEIAGTTSNYGRYDVHGGYQLYEEAIIEALNTRAEALFKPYRFMPYMQDGRTNEIERVTTFAHHDDPMFTYSEGWTVVTEGSPSSDYGTHLYFNPSYLNLPFFVNGLREGTTGATVSFQTDANSMAIYWLPWMNASGSQYKIYVNGELYKTINASKPKTIQPFISNTIELPNPSNEMLDVTIEVAAATTDVTEVYARFGTIYFGYNAEYYNTNKEVQE